jgi:hypothetical protein
MPPLPRKQRRVKALADRKQQKKTRVGPNAEESAWMAGLLPPTGGRVLQVGGASAKSAEALTTRGWRVVPLDTAEVLADAGFTGDRIDAVTCWLLDVAKAKPEALTRLRAMGLRTPDEHRLAVQTLVYRLADRVLRPGGVLQVVDRMSEPLGEALAAGILRVQRAQSKGTSLEFLSLDAHPVDAGALVSVRSRKAQ